ncbi:MAG: T9SS type A sorting domain-containing protein [Flavobacteriales bacterium]|nr:T9SS type A sorting domain-containing protein [Flavobacteriales bacterium]
MPRISFVLFSLLLVVQAIAQTPSEKASVQLSAVVQKNPARITLSWSAMPNTSSLTVYRKTKAATSWGSALAYPSASATQYQDNSVSVGTTYEYRVVRSASGATGQGYICTGIEVPLPDYRGKLVLLVDNTMAAPLSSELAQLEQDLRADGWVVLRNNVSRTASTASIRNIVKDHYNSDPANVKAVYIVGHVPVPYSGNIAPDGHGEHQGAWPCDGYYGEMNGNWTDNSVYNNSSQREANRNVPGDGKFDQSSFPSTVELQVGRVDLYDMPAFAQSETELLRTYLNRAHNYKVKQWTPVARGIVFDNFYYMTEPMAGSAWRNMGSMVGHNNITEANVNGGNYYTLVNNQSYLWTYSSGGGSQAYEGSTLTYNGANQVGTTQNYASTNAGGVFNMSFGSYFGDWDNKNNFLRAPLAKGSGLTSCWAAIPAWYFHHMGMGENVGFSTLVAMNNNGLYTPQTDGWESTSGTTHLGLMGDPSLRQKMVAPPTSLSITNNSGSPSFTWSAAAGGVDGYHIYRFDGANGITRLTNEPVTSTSYYNPAVPFMPGTEYMVRAVKLQVDPGGSYWNLSLGAIGQSSGTTPPPATDCNGVVGGSALPGTACNDGNSSTTNDRWNAACQCTGTPVQPADCAGVPGGSALPGTACNDGNPGTINDVWSSSCECTGTSEVITGCDGIRTESQGAWGGTASGNNPAKYLADHFASAFPAPNYLTVGFYGRKLTLTNATAVKNLLPTRGTPAALPQGALTNPSTLNNRLVGELVALKLSVRFDEQDPAFSSSSTLLRNMQISSGTFAGWTVQDLITAADARLGGDTYYTQSFQQFMEAINQVNMGYRRGQMDSGYLMCPGATQNMVVLAVPEDRSVENGLEVLVFPNPVHDLATFEITGAAADQRATVAVYSATGVLMEEVFSGILQAGIDRQVQWDPGTVAPGMYFYRVISGEKTVTGRIIVQ